MDSEQSNKNQYCKNDKPRCGPGGVHCLSFLKLLQFSFPQIAGSTVTFRTTPAADTLTSAISAG
jgi:hypothetical protein